METDLRESPFYRSLMSGLFAGIVITIANLAYNFLYRDLTSFNPSYFVNVTTIIFISILLSLVAGILYYLIVPYAKKSRLLYIILFVLLTAFVTYLAFTVQRSVDMKVTTQFHGLFAGIVIITGLVDAFLIPYMAEHKNPII
jgi:ABC-type thiamin/hydroxymethylpyrimidine transport system permease subunit